MSAKPARTLTVHPQRALGVSDGIGRYAVVRPHVRLVERLDDNVVGRLVAGYRLSEHVLWPAEQKQRQQ